MAELVEKLSEISETGKQLSGTGEIRDRSIGKQLKGVYGFNVRSGWAMTK